MTNINVLCKNLLLLANFSSLAIPFSSFYTSLGRHGLSSFWCRFCHSQIFLYSVLASNDGQALEAKFLCPYISGWMQSCPNQRITRS